jgi:hypothetical protein
MLSYKYSLEHSESLAAAWEDITGMESAMCAEIKKKALESCKLIDEYAIIRENLSEVATMDADEFVAEAISSSKNTKLVKTVKKIFDEKVR